MKGLTIVLAEDLDIFSQFPPLISLLEKRWVYSYLFIDGNGSLSMVSGIMNSQLLLVYLLSGRRWVSINSYLLIVKTGIIRMFTV